MTTEPDYILDQPGKFQITFRPHGAKRDRTVFAKLVRERVLPDGTKLFVYSRLTHDGDVPEPMEVIMVTEGSHSRRPLVMNLKYAEFEVKHKEPQAQETP